MHVFADDGDCYPPLRPVYQIDDFAPAVEVGLRSVQAEMLAHLAVEPFRVVGAGDGIDRLDIERRDHPALPQITEKGDLLSCLRRDLPLAAAQQDVRLNPEAEQLLRRMLSRFGL